ncbi:anthocyanidin 3-O-glucosyltransferase 2-like [Corylus avellana]|uniref:anthocyanidin 3-O-glucosyltransferase 2-like n=1 Tax=Corylus avellana TaxID=13451 RepID=UPI00286BF68F|nr:anthocyanidin 3-O-glucosyltransferase 2-like [Corylus avellana]
MKRAEMVFVPAPGVGHLVSLIEFAKCLLERDDRLSITVLVIKPPLANILDAFIQSIAASHTRIKCILLPPVDPPPGEVFLSSLEKFFTDFIESHKSHVKEAIISSVLSNSIPLAALVVDILCSAMIDVAHELGVPSYVFFPSNAACLGFLLYMPTRHDQVGIEFSESDPESVMPSYVNPVPSSVLPTFAFHKEGGYISMVYHGRKCKEANGILVNSFHELESHAFSSFLADGIPPVYGVGPLINLKGEINSEANEAEHEKIRKWLDDQPPSSVVFLCFGSLGSFSAPQLKETALALERSGHRFIWSVRLESPPGEKVAAPSDSPNLEEVLPVGFLERTREIGMICGWAPQVEVLAHKAIGGFVSHCGWNSILESLWHGVPIAAWPIYAEQQINSFQMVRDLGLAVELKMDYRRGGEVVAAEEIEKAVKCLMDGESEVRKRVKEMSEKSRKAVVNGGSSFASIGRLIESMLGNNVESTL